LLANLASISVAVPQVRNTIVPIVVDLAFPKLEHGVLIEGMVLRMPVAALGALRVLRGVCLLPSAALRTLGGLRPHRLVLGGVSP
jgi:hypothetical protein